MRSSWLFSLLPCLFLLACGPAPDPTEDDMEQTEDTEDTEDTAVPTSTTPAPTSTTPPDTTGNGVWATLETQNSAGRSGSFYLPPGYASAGALPMVVAYHGTGGDGGSMLGMFHMAAQTTGFIIVAPDSRVSPSGELTWEVGTHPGEITEDYTHTLSCIDEVLAYPGVSLDEARVLATGHSGGGSSAPYIATNEALFTHFAVLHGGVFVGGLGSHDIPGWFSTGDVDDVRSPEHVQEQADAMVAAGFTDVEVHIFAGGHDVSDEERDAMLSWWLD